MRELRGPPQPKFKSPYNRREQGHYEGFTGSEGRMLHLLLSCSIVSAERLFDVMHHTKGSHDLKMVRVMVSKLRRKLKPLGLRIEVSYGVGYFIPREMKPKAIEQLQPVQEAA